MNSTALSIKSVKVAVSALLAAAAFMALGLAFGTSAKAANAGDPFQAEFNYAGLNVDVQLAQIDELVLEDNGPPLVLSGQYTDSNGNFTVPQATGLQFPDIAIPLTDDVDLDGQIDLAKAGTGNYNSETGQMSADLSISLTIGVSNMAALPIPGLGTGPLRCNFQPINIAFSTENGWPHDGYRFANPAAIEDGAMAGAWREKPKATAQEGPQEMCDLIGNFLQDVGGLWVAQSTTPISAMPPASSPKPSKPTCAEIGKVGTWGKCTDPVVEQPKCPAGTEGTPPNNCTKIQSDAAAAISITKKATVKAGKTVKIKVTVKNTGEKALTGSVALKSSNKQVKVPKSFAVNVAGGGSVTKTIVVKAGKKAKGKANITASITGKSAKSTVTVKAAKKKRK